jgi:hypothetical protein
MQNATLSRQALLLLLLGAVTGCAMLRPSADTNAPNKCLAESGYLDSTNGCSAEEDYPDCYLVCPAKGSRTRL